MATTSLIALLLTLLMGSLPLLLSWTFRRRIDARRNEAETNPSGLATLIIPCKGLDPGFRENIEAFLHQDYPALHLIFTVAREDDPAYQSLNGILRESANGAPMAELVIAGIESGRAQKLTNQLAALGRLTRETEFLVFLDSDIRPDPGFIRRLIGPLTSPQVGATTGFRWYHPPHPALGSLLRSAWNAGALPFLVDPRRAFAWGGAMAMRREVFDRAGIAERWQRALSDDFPFTLGVRELGLELRFVASCIAISHEASTLAQTLEFTNRQSIISRVYFPPLWWGAAIAHSAANLLLLYGLAGVGAWLVGGGAAAAIGAGCLLLLPLEMINAAVLFTPIRRLLPQLADDLERLRWYYVLTAPLASLLSLVNTLYSLTTRRITWRGVRYELRSPTETVVLGGE